MDMTPERGAIPIELDRPRTLFFDMTATGQLLTKYGPAFTLALMLPVNDKDGKPSGIRMTTVEALAFFLWVGLGAEGRRNGDALTLEQVQSYIRPFTVTVYFNLVVAALTGAIHTPDLPGQKPVPDPKAQPRKTGAKRASTSSKRSGSRSASSRSGRKSSGG